MRIDKILSDDKLHISFEVFPQRYGQPIEPVLNTVKEISKLHPAFCSVTYGANGGASENTVKVASYIKNELNTPTLAHLTCVGSSKDDLDEKLVQLKENNIQNILALRGDIIDKEKFANKEDLLYASELIEYIKLNYDFCVGAACYPEVHPESKNQNEDINYLKLKQDMGADFITTQMFFDNSIFYNFMYKLRSAGVTIPVVAGIMPVTNVNQLKKIKELSNANIPSKFLSIADKFQDDKDSMKQAGIIYACNQIIDLISNGVNNIHIYTMNNASVAKQIMQNMSHIVNNKF
ncbi:methylenetetrahydrofolate reductase [NAD(P)H] [Peptostreptococcus sp.]|jgi:methylenetetrahydrofolate reductase (NAD(P)H)|uniref:methylenetetrahydrofolate reductase [NAD(P)H] n=1 Tax=Peptostreptococcus sp. TaxID=1262 RepID=UPI0028D38CF9|nr:methylenetetrahydrofolate reductase [NAD(P)H] [uncultured Peptostreptococcus sp.]